MSSRLPLRWGIVLGLLTGGCHSIKPEASIEGAPQACCTVADPQLRDFKGCRIPRRNCKSREGEKWWMRGSVSCGPVDEANCEGGRCCHYQQQYDPSVGEPIDNWAPPGHDKPTNNVTDPDAPPQHTVPEPSESPPASDASAALTVTITADGTLVVGKDVVDPAELEARLCAAAEASGATELRITADPAADQALAVRATDAAKACGLDRVGIAATSDAETGP